MTSLILVLVITVIIIGAWNAFGIHQLNKRPLRSNEINDKHYWELKYKMQFLITAFTLITAIAAYFGITTLSGVEDKIKTEFKSTTDSLRIATESLNLKLEQLNISAIERDSSLRVAEKTIRDLGIRNRTLNNSLQLSANSLNQLKENIQLLNESNKNQSITYIVENIKVGDMDKSGAWPKIYFKDLVQANGKPMPVFASPPIVVVASMRGSDASIRNVTNESFEILSMMSTEPEPPYIFILHLLPKDLLSKVDRHNFGKIQHNVQNQPSRNSKIFSRNCKACNRRFYRRGLCISNGNLSSCS